MSDDLFAGEPIPLAEMLAEATRELHMRRSVYPRRVSGGKMTQAQATRHLEVQRAIVALLEKLIAEGTTR
jgi:hypothetical protein